MRIENRNAARFVYIINMRANVEIRKFEPAFYNQSNCVRLFCIFVNNDTHSISVSSMMALWIFMYTPTYLNAMKENMK